MDHTTDAVMEEDMPLALRRPRRSITRSVAKPIIHTKQDSQLTTNKSNDHVPSNRGTGLYTPPSTPHRSKKRVRFSDPGPNANALPSSPSASFSSSGLTPFIRRTSLLNSPPPSGSNSRRRHSEPLSSLWNLSGLDTSSPTSSSPTVSGTLQFAPLRQVLSGRVKRRLRRNHLSEEVQMIEFETRGTRRSQIEEIQRLKDELAQKTEEIRRLKEDAEVRLQISGEAGLEFNVSECSNSAIREREREASIIREELARRKQRAQDHADDAQWRVLARDPFNPSEYDLPSAFDLPDFDDAMNMVDEEDVLLSTPSRHVHNSQDSIPSPPTTLPDTPCKVSIDHGQWQGQDTGVQVDTPDLEKEFYERRLYDLHAELESFRRRLEKNDGLRDRLREKLATYLSSDSIPRDQIDETEEIELDTALDAVLTKLALSQSQAKDTEAQIFALKSEILSLNFASTAESTIEALKTQFRSARLELERLFPGETSIGFEPSHLLELLISRLKSLQSRVQQQESDIDQYHALESNLRLQLCARVDACKHLYDQAGRQKETKEALEKELADRDQGINRLNHALEGYRKDVKNLEILVGQLEHQVQEKESLVENLRGEVETVRGQASEQLTDSSLEKEMLLAERQGQDILLDEARKRLDAALAAAAEVQKEKESVELQIKDMKVLELTREEAHGRDLATRDARVEELRVEVERVNGSSKDAWNVVKTLRGELISVKKRDASVMEDFRHICGKMGLEIASTNSSSSETGAVSSSVAASSATGIRMMNGMLARRVSGGTESSRGKKRRRYDSGLGFLEEEDELDGVDS